MSRIDPNKEIKTLDEAIKLLPADTPVCIGMKTAFVFLGTAGEYRSDIDFLDSVYGKAEPGIPPLRERDIRKVYLRSTPWEGAAVALIVMGTEEGPAWSKKEYDAWFRKRRASQRPGNTANTVSAESTVSADVAQAE